MVNVAFLQMNSVPLRSQTNLSTAERLLSEASQRGAQLAVLPEMFAVGYYFGEELFNCAEQLNGETVAWLKSRAEHLGLYIVTTVVERFNGHLYNTMVLVGPGTETQYYRKRNPTWQEWTVWRRSDDPGPGIFDTPFGRIGGAICFDAFTREAFEGFKQSKVDLVLITSCWGVLRPPRTRPDAWFARSALEKWSSLASEVIPRQYVSQLHVPVVFVCQAGTTHTPVPAPRFYPFGSLVDAIGDFWGRSKILDAGGSILASAPKSQVEYSGLAAVDVRQAQEYPPAKKVDVRPGYLASKYYFVPPPLFARLFQEWCYRGFDQEYERRRALYAVQAH